MGARAPYRLGLAAALLVPVAATPAAAAPCSDVFPAAFAAQLQRDFPAQRVTASVVDTRTGCAYALHDGMRITTASVVKAGVLGAVLLRAQDQRRGLTAWERARTGPMIHLSHNNPFVSDLLRSVGGVAGMDRADRRWGLTATTNTAAYGATSTTARDRTRLALQLLHGGGPLAAAGRAEAWRAMSTVHPTQTWGITAGVPRGWAVALKNGFYPMRGQGWRVGSTGFVRRGSSGGYAITVLTDRGPSQAQGMRLVETVARRVSAVLAGGPPAARPVERSVCTTTSSREGWTAVARRLRSTAVAVRHVSGGNPSPLQGQRACRVELRAP
jgi:beta-lactamase class A